MNFRFDGLRFSHILLSCASFWVAVTAVAQPSAARRPGEDWRRAAMRAGIRAESGSSLDLAKPPAQLDRRYEFPVIHDKRVLVALFEQTRDWRFLLDPDVAGFKRRLSWLYPDDGCFMRAEFVARVLNQQAHRSWVNKLFVFGNLEVDTPNSPDGKVHWWYHVVAATSFAGHIVVFDPAIDPRAPMLMESWLTKVTKEPASLKVALCRSGAYSPSDACDSVQLKVPEPELISTAQDFLHAERERIKELGRDPARELGSNPPWAR